MRTKAFLIAAALMLLLLAVQPGAGQFSEVTVEVSGPLKVSTNSTHQYTVTIGGGPAASGGGRWGYNARFVDVDTENLTQPIKPADGLSTTTSTFVFNVTFPVRTQVATLSVNGTSMKDNDTMWNRESLEIAVVVPKFAEINATIRNPVNIEIKDLEVRFFVEDLPIGSQFVDLPPGGLVRVVHRWDVTSVDDGKYRVKILVDPNNEVQELDEGDNVIFKDIYLGEPPPQPENPYTWLIAVVIAVVIVVLLVLRMKMR